LKKIGLLTLFPLGNQKGLEFDVPIGGKIEINADNPSTPSIKLGIPEVKFGAWILGIKGAAYIGINPQPKLTAREKILKQGIRSERMSDIPWYIRL
jgi:hypothetical protein